MIVPPALQNDSMDVDDDTSSLEAAHSAAQDMQSKLVVKELIVTQMIATRPIVRSIHTGPVRTRLERFVLQRRYHIS